MAPAGAFGVIRVNGPSLDRGNRVFDETGLVQGVGVNGDLYVELVGNREAGVDRGRRRAPVLVELETDGTRQNLLAQQLRRRGGPLAEAYERQPEPPDRVVHAP